VADLVSGCFGKRQGPGVPVDFAVDDDASVVAHGGYRVTPFDGDHSEDGANAATVGVEAATRAALRFLPYPRGMREGDRRGSNPRPSEPQSADTCF
jgi:hypothetical protein